MTVEMQLWLSCITLIIVWLITLYFVLILKIKNDDLKEEYKFIESRYIYYKDKYLSIKKYIDEN